MSIHHVVTIHCDACGHWIHGDGQTTAQRRARGWRIWRSDDGAGAWRHLCPRCVDEDAELARVGQVNRPIGEEVFRHGERRTCNRCHVGVEWDADCQQWWVPYDAGNPPPNTYFCGSFAGHVA